MEFGGIPPIGLGARMEVGGIPPIELGGGAESSGLGGPTEPG